MKRDEEELHMRLKKNLNVSYGQYHKEPKDYTNNKEYSLRLENWRKKC